ncbi:MAG: hypothetical protein H0W11_04090 [Gemmatimonadetes bacterium]|nr:hypothetical protein [Gemmatimonadota bacterium]MBA4158240.1 hypothetical protein [Gemmatimonadota bacterium]
MAPSNRPTPPLRKLARSNDQSSAARARRPAWNRRTSGELIAAFVLMLAILLGACSDANTPLSPRPSGADDAEGIGIAQVEDCTPGTLTNGQNHPCTTSIPSELHAWTFTATEGDFLHLSIARVSGNLNPQLRLLSPTGDEVGLVRNFVSTELVVADAPASGTYRVIVSDWGADNTGDYVLQGIGIGGPPQNQPPVATITSPTSGATFTEGAEIDFAGSATDPEDGTLTGGALVWTSNRDGQIGTGTSFSRSDLSVGTHTITLTATDSEGATGTASVTIAVEAEEPPPPPNQPPEVEIDSPEDGATFTEGDEITFTGSATDPEDGALTGDALVWTSDQDGQIGTGTSFTRSDLSVGTHVITLTATDSERLTGTASVTITITEPPENQPPTASISSPADGAEFTAGEAVTFQGSATDPEDGPLTGGALVWTSSRDGQIGTGTSFTRSDLSVGMHVITLTATDSEGLTGSASVTITLVAAPPPPPPPPPPPTCTPVDVLVGNRLPARTVDLSIPWLGASVLDIESYLPRPGAQADDVRIGASWETGTPAMLFEISDSDGDGRRDIMLRYDLARLMDEGNLSEETSSLTVWGRDRATGTMYCGTAAVTVVP